MLLTYRPNRKGGNQFTPYYASPHAIVHGCGWLGRCFECPVVQVGLDDFHKV
jgi:hypothetical protein